MQPKFISLGLDTSTSNCEISIVSGSDILIEINKNIEKKHAETVMVLAQKALNSVQLDWTDLDVIGVGVGPGNFTGIRISVAAVRGLSFALKIPAFGIKRYEAFCYEQNKDLLCSINAPNGHVYTVRYSKGAFGSCSLNNLDSLTFPNCENIIGDQSEKISKKLNLKEEKQIYSPSTSIAKIAQEMPIEKSPPKPFYPSATIYGAPNELNSKYTS